MRIVIADDHALFRGGLRLQLCDLLADADIVEASSFHDVLALVRAGPPPELAILDLGMPGPPWMDAMRRLRDAWPAARLVVVTADDKPDSVQHALSAGAHGFILKTEQPHVFAAALRLVLSGGHYFPLSALGREPAPPPALPARPLHPVTGRQKDVLALIAEGCANKEIACRLKLTEGTVKLHVAAILRALGAYNRTHAVAIARNCNLLGK